MYYSIAGAIICITEEVFSGELTEDQAYAKLLDAQEHFGATDYDMLENFIEALEQCKNGLNMICVKICARLMARY